MLHLRRQHRQGRQRLGQRFHQQGVRSVRVATDCASKFVEIIVFCICSNDSVESLLEVLEKVSIFRRAIDYNDMSDVLANKYSQYAEALASQGRLQTAMGYLSQLNDPVR